MDHQTLRDEHESQAASLPNTHGPTCNGRAATGPAVTAPTSLARRCDHIIDLIDELLTARASCANTANARNERHCQASPRTEPGARERGAGGHDVAS